MRGLASYLLAGILVVLTMNFFAPPVGLGFVVRRNALVGTECNNAIRRPDP